MGVDKCHLCDLALNRQGEKRPGIKCKQCKMEHCYKCAEMTIELCEMVRGMEKGFWTCNKCETKSTDRKSVLESMKLIKTEFCTIKEGQAEQQAEREQVVEGLKAVEAVAKKLERIEEVQESHDQRRCHKKKYAEEGRGREED